MNINYVHNWISNNYDIQDISTSAKRFVAAQQAQDMGNLDINDLANVLLIGIPPVTDIVVSEWISIHYESFHMPTSACVDDATHDLLYRLHTHFNVPQ